MALAALLVFCALFQLTAAALPNCSYPAIFAFGDSLTDTGNSIAAFPELFKEAELDPMGQEFPMHAADRYTDGKLLLDFLGTRLKCCRLALHVRYISAGVVGAVPTVHLTE